MSGKFLLDTTVLACDTDTAKKYGDIKNQLKEKGQPLPENDIWIAAVAQQYDLTLITRDTHFHIIENLKMNHGNDPARNDMFTMRR